MFCYFRAGVSLLLLLLVLLSLFPEEGNPTCIGLQEKAETETSLMLRNQFPQEEEHGQGVEKARKGAC